MTRTVKRKTVNDPVAPETAERAFADNRLAMELFGSHHRNLARIEQVMDVAINRTCIGRVLPVLLDRPDRKPGQLVGRSPYMQVVHVDDSIDGPGAIVRLVITAAHANSLMGVVEIREAGAGTIGERVTA